MARQVLTVDEETKLPPAPTVEALRRVITLGGPGGPRGYRFDQTVASDEWLIEHGLDFVPAGVLVVDSTGRTVRGKITVVDDDVIRLSFNGAFSGSAYLS